MDAEAYLSKMEFVMCAVWASRPTSVDTMVLQLPPGAEILEVDSEGHVLYLVEESARLSKERVERRICFAHAARGGGPPSPVRRGVGYLGWRARVAGHPTMWAFEVPVR